MKRILFLFIMLLFVGMFTGCASGGSFSMDNKIGVEVKVSEESSFFCLFDTKVEGKTFSEDLTCSGAVKVKNVIYDCKKIMVSSIGKDFKLETNCTIVADVSANNQKSIQTDWKISGQDEVPSLNNQCNWINSYDKEAVFPADWG